MSSCENSTCQTNLPSHCSVTSEPFLSNTRHSCLFRLVLCPWACVCGRESVVDIPHSAFTSTAQPTIPVCCPIIKNTVESDNQQDIDHDSSSRGHEKAENLTNGRRSPRLISLENRNQGLAIAQAWICRERKAHGGPSTPTRSGSEVHIESRLRRSLHSALTAAALAHLPLEQPWAV